MKCPLEASNGKTLFLAKSYINGVKSMFDIFFREKYFPKNLSASNDCVFSRNEIVSFCPHLKKKHIIVSIKENQPETFYRFSFRLHNTDIRNVWCDTNYLPCATLCVSFCLLFLYESSFTFSRKVLQTKLTSVLLQQLEK